MAQTLVDMTVKNDTVKQGGYLEVFLYINAFIVGFIIMAFEMLGSRYLNPYFGSGIFTWASIISTVLSALAAGYFIGGYIADRKPSLNLIGIIIVATSVWLGLVPVLADPLFERIFNSIDDVRYGSLISAILLLFVPLSLLGFYSPYAIRLMLRATKASGTVSGRVYGISTVGSILGTLVTTFYLIPLIGTRMITYVLFLCTMLCGLSFLVFGLLEKRGAPGGLGSKVGETAILLLLIFTVSSSAQAASTGNSATAADALFKLLPFVNPGKKDLIEKIETPYNSIFIYRKGSTVAMTFRYGSNDTLQSVMNLDKPMELVSPYTQMMQVGLVYVHNPEDILMLGLGAGIITRYIQRYYPETDIEVVELDGGVIDAAKKYFKVEESDKYRITESDARVYLRRSKNRYDIIMLDAFREGSVPFHLLTTEFYELVKEDMKEGGCFVVNMVGKNLLFDSSIKTLRSVFESVDVYIHPVFLNAIIVAYDKPRLTYSELKDRAEHLQRKKNFYHAISDVLQLKRDIKLDSSAKLITDDFAPVNVYKYKPGRSVTN